MRKAKICFALLIVLVLSFTMFLLTACPEEQYTVTIAEKGTGVESQSVAIGTVEVATGSVLPAGTQLTVSWTAATGYTAKLLVNGTEHSTVSPATVILTANTTLEVVATANPAATNYTVTIVEKGTGVASQSVKNGSSEVASGTSVPAGTALTVTWAAESGYSAKLWVNDAETATASGGTVTVNSNTKIQIKATSTSEPPTQAVTVNGESSIVFGTTDSTKLTYTAEVLETSNQTVEWTSSVATVATINKDSGVLTIVGVGTTRVTATSVADSTKSGYIDVTITKASQAAPTGSVTASNTTDTSITVTTVSGAEYSKDGTNWQDSNVFSELTRNTPYTISVRKKATATHNASAAISATISTTNTAIEGFASALDDLIDSLPAGVSGLTYEHIAVLDDIATLLTAIETAFPNTVDQEEIVSLLESDVLGGERTLEGLEGCLLSYQTHVGTAIDAANDIDTLLQNKLPENPTDMKLKHKASALEIAAIRQQLTAEQDAILIELLVEKDYGDDATAVGDLLGDFDTEAQSLGTATTNTTLAVNAGLNTALDFGDKWQYDGTTLGAKNGDDITTNINLQLDYSSLLDNSDLFLRVFKLVSPLGATTQLLAFDGNTASEGIYYNILLSGTTDNLEHNGVSDFNTALKSFMEDNDYISYWGDPLGKVFGGSTDELDFQFAASVAGTYILTIDIVTLDLEKNMVVVLSHQIEVTVTAVDSLTTHKQQKVEALTQYATDKGVDNYSEANWTALEQARDAGITAINNAGSETDVDTELGKAKAAIDLILTLLQEYQAEKVADLEQYATDKGADNYSEAKWKELEDERDAGIAAINSATSTGGVDTEFGKATDAIDAVLTLFQEHQVEKKDALDTLSGDLETKFNVSDGNTPAENIYKFAVKSVQDIVAAAKTAIDQADTIQAVTDIFDLAKFKLDLAEDMFDYIEGDTSSGGLGGMASYGSYSMFSNVSVKVNSYLTGAKDLTDETAIQSQYELYREAAGKIVTFAELEAVRQSFQTYSQGFDEGNYDQTEWETLQALIASFENSIVISYLDSLEYLEGEVENLKIEIEKIQTKLTGTDKETAIDTITGICDTRIGGLEDGYGLLTNFEDVESEITKALNDLLEKAKAALNACSTKNQLARVLANYVEVAGYIEEIIGFYYLGIEIMLDSTIMDDYYKFGFSSFEELRAAFNTSEYSSHDNSTIRLLSPLVASTWNTIVSGKTPQQIDIGTEEHPTIIDVYSLELILELLLETDYLNGDSADIEILLLSASNWADQYLGDFCDYILSVIDTIYNILYPATQN